MRVKFDLLDGGNEFIRISEIDEVSHTPVYRKLRNTVTRLTREQEVITAVKESTGEFVSIHRDEEVILITR